MKHALPIKCFCVVFCPSRCSPSPFLRLPRSQRPSSLCHQSAQSVHSRRYHVTTPPPYRIPAALRSKAKSSKCNSGTLSLQQAQPTIGPFTVSGLTSVMALIRSTVTRVGSTRTSAASSRPQVRMRLWRICRSSGRMRVVMMRASGR